MGYVPKSRRLERSVPIPKGLEGHTVIVEVKEPGWMTIKEIRITAVGTFLTDMDKTTHCFRPISIVVGMHDENVPIDELVKLWENKRGIHSKKQET